MSEFTVGLLAGIALGGMVQGALLIGMLVGTCEETRHRVNAIRRAGLSAWLSGRTDARRRSLDSHRGSPPV